MKVWITIKWFNQSSLTQSHTAWKNILKRCARSTNEWKKKKTKQSVYLIFCMIFSRVFRLFCHILTRDFTIKLLRQNLWQKRGKLQLTLPMLTWTGTNGPEPIINSTNFFLTIRNEMQRQILHSFGRLKKIQVATIRH